MKMIRDHGQAKKYYHDIEGYNGRLDSIQAGWLSVKLRHLAKWNQSRRELAHRYHELFRRHQRLPDDSAEAAWTKGVYHLYVVRVADREALQAHLAEAGIATGIHYPIPLHLQKAYQHLKYKQGDFPVTEKVAAEIVSLPMFPQLTARATCYGSGACYGICNLQGRRDPITITTAFSLIHGPLLQACMREACNTNVFHRSLHAQN